MKKAVCILLCLMMIIPSMVSLAEQKTVKSITLKVTQPKGGTTIMDNSWPEPPSGAHYTVVECYWMQKKGSTFQDMGETDVFVAGEEYQMDLRVVPDATYKFDPNVEVISNVTFKDRWMQGDDCLVTLQCTAVEAPPVPAEETTLSKLKSVKVKALNSKQIQISWKKLSKEEQQKIQKIEIQYSTDKTFKTDVKSKWAKKGKDSYIIKGLKNNTKYYIRIRAYKKSGDVISVSKWTTKNKVTPKK